jgi:hypothetical protein
VLVRLTDDLVPVVEAGAARTGLTPPAYIRSLIAADGGTDPADALPTPKRKGRTRLTSDDVLAVNRLREVVAELSGSMKVAAVDTREQGIPILHDQVEALIPGIKAAVRDLIALKQALEEAG